VANLIIFISKNGEKIPINKPQKIFIFGNLFLLSCKKVPPKNTNFLSSSFLVKSHIVHSLKGVGWAIDTINEIGIFFVVP
jgi:hypothetical protein